jgi:mannosyltransferase OCH1-like enzyme
MSVPVYAFSEIAHDLRIGAGPPGQRGLDGYVPDHVKREVPKTIHFIWIGSELPENYRRNVLTYVRNNPSYVVCLWTDRPCVFGEVRLCRIDALPMSARAIYDSASSWVEKADVARYEIVFAEGGIYCDIDSVSLRPFDSLLLSPFVCYVPSWHNVSNAVFGFPAQSTFLDFVLKSLWRTRDPSIFDDVPQRTGPTFFTACLAVARADEIRFVDVCALIIRTDDGYTYHTKD